MDALDWPRIIHTTVICGHRVSAGSHANRCRHHKEDDMDRQTAIRILKANYANNTGYPCQEALKMAIEALESKSCTCSMPAIAGMMRPWCVACGRVVCEQ